MPIHGLQLITLESVAPQPWRNGGGVTRELFAWPDATDWTLRISVAEITADGPFSPYPGVDRWFAVLGGNGVALHQGTDRTLLGTKSPPHRFDGAEPPGCSLQGGATRDLNLMLRRWAGQGSMRSVDRGQEWRSTAPLRGLFTCAALTLQIDDADAARLPAWSLVVSRHASHQRWRTASEQDAPRALWMEFHPRPVP